MRGIFYIFRPITEMVEEVSVIVIPKCVDKSPRLWNIVKIGGCSG